MLFKTNLAPEEIQFSGDIEMDDIDEDDGGTKQGVTDRKVSS